MGGFVNTGTCADNMVPRLPDTSMAGEQPRWYAVHTRCRHEKRAATELATREVDVFLPLVRQISQWSDRKKVIETPLFSCYLFIRARLAADIRTKTLRVPGVLGFVGLNGSPAPIPSWEIESIQKILAGRQTFSSHEFLRVGQRVRIRGGALNGVQGILTGRNGDRRLVVSIEPIQQAVAITIEGYDVEPVL